MAKAFMDKGYDIISGGTDNHSMLVDLRTKFPELTGRVAEQALVAADITTNKTWYHSIHVLHSRLLAFAWNTSYHNSWRKRRPNGGNC